MQIKVVIVSILIPTGGSRKHGHKERFNQHGFIRADTDYWKSRRLETDSWDQNSFAVRMTLCFQI